MKLLKDGNTATRQHEEVVTPLAANVHSSPLTVVGRSREQGARGIDHSEEPNSWEGSKYHDSTMRGNDGQWMVAILWSSRGVISESCDGWVPKGRETRCGCLDRWVVLWSSRGVHMHFSIRDRTGYIDFEDRPFFSKKGITSQVVDGTEWFFLSLNGFYQF